MTLCIIQARLGSTRLPGKALMDLGGSALIDHVIERVLAIPSIDHMVLAVPETDAGLHVWATPVHGVAAEDVLGRFARVAEGWPDHDVIMRVSGDCPLLDPMECERVLQHYLANPSLDYVWNVSPGYVDGEDCEVFSAAMLQRAHREATDPADREHVTPWMRRHGKTATLPPLSDRRHLKTSVDTLEDLERVREMVNTWTT